MTVLRMTRGILVDLRIERYPFL
uniref:Uncharacterized protein n=1 Tax=Anguilla anguilla TaxID=7936 RepID=A0A0E9UAR3_ANGAN